MTEPEQPEVEGTEASDEDPAIQVAVISDEEPPPYRYKRIRPKDSWLRDRFDPTAEDTKQREDLGFPDDVEIVAGFLMSCDLVTGAPDKAEIFRLSKATATADKDYDGFHYDRRNTLHLWAVTPSPIPSVYYTVAHPPIGIGFGDITEVNYNVRLQAIVRRIALHRVKVISGCEHDDDPKLTFEATMYPGAAMQRTIQVVRVAVHVASYGHLEVVSETSFPRSDW